MSGPLLDGGVFRLRDQLGKVVVVNFWASWCAPCVYESPMLDALYRQFAGAGVTFVGVDTKDDREAAKAFVSARKLSYPMVYDETAKIALQLGIPAGGLPITAIVDREGRIAAVYLGRVERTPLLSALRRVAAETA